MFEENSTYLDDLAKKLGSKKIEKVDLYEDIKSGVNRIQKLKNEHSKNNNNYKKYSIDKPPPIFIRKAIETDE